MKVQNKTVWNLLQENIENSQNKLAQKIRSAAFDFLLLGRKDQTISHQQQQQSQQLLEH